MRLRSTDHRARDERLRRGDRVSAARRADGRAQDPSVVLDRASRRRAGPDERRAPRPRAARREPRAAPCRRARHRRRGDPVCAFARAAEIERPTTDLPIRVARLGRPRSRFPWSRDERHDRVAVLARRGTRAPRRDARGAKSHEGGVSLEPQRRPRSLAGRPRRDLGAGLCEHVRNGRHPRRGRRLCAFVLHRRSLCGGDDRFCCQPRRSQLVHSVDDDDVPPRAPRCDRRRVAPQRRDPPGKSRSARDPPRERLPRRRRRSGDRDGNDRRDEGLRSLHRAVRHRGWQLRDVRYLHDAARDEVEGALRRRSPEGRSADPARALGGGERSNRRPRPRAVRNRSNLRGDERFRRVRRRARRSRGHHRALLGVGPAVSRRGDPRLRIPRELHPVRERQRRCAVPVAAAQQRDGSDSAIKGWLLADASPAAPSSSASLSPRTRAPTSASTWRRARSAVASASKARGRPRPRTACATATRPSRRSRKARRAARSPFGFESPFITCRGAARPLPPASGTSISASAGASGEAIRFKPRSARRSASLPATPRARSAMENRSLPRS